MMPDVAPIDKPILKNNIPLVTFVSRYWMYLILTVALNFAILSKHVWYWVQLPAARDGTPGDWQGMTSVDICGALLYIPAICSLVFMLLLLTKHLYYRATIDADTHDGTYIADWRACTSFQRVAVQAAVTIGILIAFAIIGASMARGATPDQESRWNAARINPAFSIALDLDVALFKKNMARYQAITAMRDNGVPASVIFCLHQRESSGNFRCHPHEGSPLTARTRYVPKGRLPLPAQPPFTFEQSAADAYYVCDRLDLVAWKSAQAALQGIESFNGLGYQKFHPDVPSPYLWNGTLINGRATRGKYTGDGHFDRAAVDKQLGVAAILLRLREQGIKAPWDS
jgi:lysozyme family protein